jgi:hypothetical protein
MNASTLRFDPGGHIGCLYTEVIDLRALGRLEVFRATDIRFCEKTQQWNVRCASTGKLLHSDPSREACLAWEHANLQPGGQTQDPKVARFCQNRTARGV